MTASLDIPAGSNWLTYYRDSGHEKQGASCDQQDTIARQVLAEAGATLAHPPFRDEAKKGSSTVGRKDLDRLLEYAQPGVADGVLFWSSARMAREVNDAQYVRSLLRKRGYLLRFIADELPTGKYAPLFEVLKDIQNADYLETLSKEVKRGHSNLLQLGYVPSGKAAPKGYLIQREQYGTHRDGLPMLGVRWVKDAALRAPVERAWAMRLQGHSYWAIHQATHLYQHITSYKKFFENEIYQGTLVWKDKIIGQFVEPYVTQAEWLRVQALGRERAATHSRRLGNKHLLIGLLACPTCDGAMQYRAFNPKAKNGKRYPVQYYVCARKMHGNYQACPQGVIHAKPLEEFVVDYLVALYHDPARIEAEIPKNDDSIDHTVERQRLADALGQGGKEIENLLKLAALGNFESVPAKLTAIESEQAERRARLAELDELEAIRAEPLPAAALPNLADDLRNAYLSGEDEEARLLLARMVKWIELDPSAQRPYQRRSKHSPAESVRFRLRWPTA